MSRQVMTATGVVQAVATAAAGSLMYRDGNADQASNHNVGTVGNSGLGDGIYLKVVTKAVDYTATEEDFLILVDASAATRTITLPAASTSSGLLMLIKRSDSGANAFLVAVTGNASETIDGDADIWLTLKDEAVLLHCDGSNWRILHRFIPQYTVTKNANWTVGGEGTIYLCTAASDITATLPPAANWKGKRLLFKKVDAGGGDVILDGNASETIDGAATTTTTIDTQYELREIASDGTNWHVVGASSPG